MYRISILNWGHCFTRIFYSIDCIWIIISILVNLGLLLDKKSVFDSNRQLISIRKKLLRVITIEVVLIFIDLIRNSHSLSGFYDGYTILLYFFLNFLLLFYFNSTGVVVYYLTIFYCLFILENKTTHLS